MYSSPRPISTARRATVRRISRLSGHHFHGNVVIKKNKNTLQRDIEIKKRISVLWRETGFMSAMYILNGNNDIACAVQHMHAHVNTYTRICMHYVYKERIKGDMVSFLLC